MQNIEKVEEVKESVEQELMARPGITGVGVGYKYVDGVRTDTLAIVVYVEEKKDDVADPVPSEIQGIPTDVVERRFVPHGN